MDKQSELEAGCEKLAGTKRGRRVAALESSGSGEDDGEVRVWPCFSPVHQQSGCVLVSSHGLKVPWKEDVKM